MGDYEDISKKSTDSAAQYAAIMSKLDKMLPKHQPLPASKPRLQHPQSAPQQMAPLPPNLQGMAPAPPPQYQPAPGSTVATGGLPPPPPPNLGIPGVTPQPPAQTIPDDELAQRMQIIAGVRGMGNRGY